MPVKYLEEKSFFFETAAVNPATKKPYVFNVVRFTGSEVISRPYEFDITIVTKEKEVDLEAMLNNTCTLYLRPGHKLPVHGILSTFEQLNEVDGNIFFRAVLVPRLWQLSLYNISEIYLDTTVPDMIEKVLKEGGLGSHDYELKLVRTYRPWSFICQYQETHLNFISRWMEREGIFYFFEQTDSGEKLIISDTQMVHVDLPNEKVVHYSPPSGLETGVTQEAVTNFICRQVPVPKKVTLQDFNYRKSPPNVKGEAEVSSSGRGEVLIYGEHVKNNQEAKEYAKLRAEEILCRQRVYLAEGTAAFLRVGWFFTLDFHYRKSLNRKYLLTRIEHVASQAAILMAGVGIGLSEEEQRPYYRNSFEAMEEDLQFRPELLTPKPHFYGTINAKVEGEGDGKYAELDEFGRYKVKFPFDRSDRFGQKASRWIRMAQPFAGPNEGMHFPLRKGAEVLLTFMDGDPDRPIISGAVPGAEGQSVVIDENATRNTLRSSSGNFMEFQDQEGRERVLLSSPFEDSFLHIGAPNSPTREIVAKSNGSILNKAGKDYYLEAGARHTETVYSDDFQAPTGDRTKDDYKGTTNQSPYKADPKTANLGSIYLSAEKNIKMNAGNIATTEIGNPADTAGAYPSRKTPYSRMVQDDTGANPAEFTTMVNQFTGQGLTMAFFTSMNDFADGQKSSDWAYNEKNVAVTTYHGSHEINIEGDYVLNINGTMVGGASGNTIDMTSGSSVEVTQGDSAEYHEGKTYEYNKGDTYSYNEGYTYEKTKGNSDSYVEGDSYEETTGNSVEHKFGRSDEMHLGGSAEFFLGGKIEVDVSTKMEASLSISLELAVSLAFEFFEGLKISQTTLELKLKQLSIEEKSLILKNGFVGTDTFLVKLKNCFEIKT